jgi:L-seryl-tRNA(Ser) seleniumtransferase
MASMVHGTTSDDSTAYRALPSLDRLLAAAPGLIEAHGRSETTQVLREVLATARQRIGEGHSAPEPGGLLRDAETRLDARAAPRLKRVFNLTGTVLHTNLGRAVLAPRPSPPWWRCPLPLQPRIRPRYGRPR